MSEPKKAPIVMVHSNPVAIVDGRLRVDRKFHEGMIRYSEHLLNPCVSVNPALRDNDAIMDPVDVALTDLPYAVEALPSDSSGLPTPEAGGRLHQQIASARLVYGTGQSYRLAKRMGRTFVSLQEYDLPSRVSVTMNQVNNPLRRAIRAVRCTIDFHSNTAPEVRGADAVHCNGYPFFDYARSMNPNSLLYLDSRMSADMVISNPALETRLGTLGKRRLRLLFTGRYEKIKGADHVVRVAGECLRLGLDIELHCYGQGSLKDEMQRASSAGASPDRIQIHDAVSYPELAKLAPRFDLFVCCHIQNDPSCTYLESMGAGLPIVGFENLMWRRLCNESGAGRYSAIGRPAEVAKDIADLIADRDRLATLSRNAVKFARDHCFETEFGKRIKSLNSFL